MMRPLLFSLLRRGSIKAVQIVEFLRALKATIGSKLLIISDGLRAHRSRLVWQYVESQRGATALEFLLPHAPELNPVEHIWGYLKSHAMLNFSVPRISRI